MTKQLHWRSLENNTTERCIIDADEEGTTIIGMINSIGTEDVSMVYSVAINEKWEPIIVSLTGNIGNYEIDEFYMRMEGNTWLKNDESKEFAGCDFVDISLTPFTNTLPIRSLNLQPGESKIINVLYFDVVGAEVKAVQQQYTCVDKHHYRFQNVPNDFEAVIEVDDEGFVINYPGLFERG